MKTSSHFSGALSKANTAITQTKNDPQYNGNAPIEIIEEKAAFAIFPELVNISDDQLFASFAKCGLANAKTDAEIPMDFRTNALVLICELIIKDALSLPIYNMTPSDKTYETSRIVWHSGDFKPTRKAKTESASDNSKLFKTAKELEAEAEDGCGGACSI